MIGKHAFIDLPRTAHTCVPTTPKRIQYILAIVLSASLFMLLLNLGLRCAAYQVFSGLGLVESIKEACDGFVQMVKRSQAVDLGLLGANYLTAFGGIGVCIFYLSRYWRLRRLVAFAVAALLLISCFVGRNQWMVGRSNARWHDFTSDSAIEYWTQYVLTYEAWGLCVALLGAFTFSLMPIFRPSEEYWLLLGLCPRCGYELAAGTHAGCPECGWNRSTQVKRTE